MSVVKITIVTMLSILTSIGYSSDLVTVGRLIKSSKKGCGVTEKPLEGFWSKDFQIRVDPKTRTEVCYKGKKKKVTGFNTSRAVFNSKLEKKRATIGYAIGKTESECIETLSNMFERFSKRVTIYEGIDTKQLYSSSGGAMNYNDEDYVCLAFVDLNRK